MTKPGRAISTGEEAADASKTLASCLSFMVERCPEQAAEMLRVGLYSNEPLVNELIKDGLHERIGADAMRNILGELPWAGEYSVAERLDLLAQMTDTKRGAAVASSALALVKNDRTLVADYLSELRRYIRGGQDDGRNLMVAILSTLSQSGAEINPRYVLKGHGSSWVESSLSNLMAGSLADQDDDDGFASRLETAREFIKIGAKATHVEIHSLLTAVPLERITHWLQMLKEEGADLGMVGSAFDEKAIAGKSKSVKVAPVDPDRVALATAWMAQQTLSDIRRATLAP